MTTPPTPLTIRPATRADIPFLAWCNAEASSPAPGFCYWDALLAGTNTTTSAFLAAVFTADALAWGRYEDFLLVETDGQVVAGASGFMMDADDYRPLRLDRLPAVAQHLGWDAATLAQVVADYTAVWSNARDPTLAATAPWTIECVAVVPAARGRGIARQLVQALLARGRSRGHDAASIAVTLGNDAARRVYETVGFQHYLTYGPAYFDGAFPGTIKYRIALGA